MEKKRNERYIVFGVGLAFGLFVGMIMGILVLVEAVTEHIGPLIEKIEIETITIDLNETKTVEAMYEIMKEDRQIPDKKQQEI